jgi:two-component system OmpR family sensor kinase
VVSFLFLLKSNQRFEEKHLEKKYHPIVRMVLKECHFTDEIEEDLENELQNIAFRVIRTEEEMEKVLQNGKEKLRFKRNEHMKVEIIEYQDAYYLDIKTPSNHFLLKDENPIESNSYLIVLIFMVMLISFVLIFFTIFRKLYAIKKLHHDVVLLGEEKFDFREIKTNSKDEISLLACEFNATAKKLKEIKEARNVFIRNIMHELKTPITKGKFLIELPNDSENKLLMQKVFYRLESLINEFASIEELLAVKDLDRKEYYLLDIIDNAIDLMIDIDDEIEFDIKEEKVNVHFKLFSIAVKNLLDNALKHGTNKKIKVSASQDYIEVVNEGEMLAFPLEYYFEPFKKENTNNEGFGLGLYITSHILKAHHFGFGYEYKEGKNIFKIDFEVDFIVK